MFRKILAAVDVSPISESVFEEALFLAKAAHAQLALVHAFNLDEEGEHPAVNFSTLEPYSCNCGPDVQCYIGHPTLEHFKAIDNPELHFLQAHVKQAAIQQVHGEFFVCLGNRTGPMLCNFARAWQADLIVLGRRGRSGLSELLLGSVSNYVVHHAPCSVHVVNRQSTNAQGAADSSATLSSQAARLSG